MKSVARGVSCALALALAFCFMGSLALRGQEGAPASPTVVPPLIRFTGVMTSSGSQNRAASSASGALVTATFSLYELQEGGTPLWSETQKVQLDEQGRYVVLLGATSPAGLPLDLFTSGKALWLGVQPQLSGAGELPRVLMVAVPYALKASDSDTLGGKPASAYALAGAPAVVELAGVAPSTNPAQPGSHQDEATAKPAAAQPLTACTAVTSDGTAAANEIAKFTTACNIEKSLLRDTGTAVAVGGTATPGALLDVQFNSTATTGTVFGHRVLSSLAPTAASSATTSGFFSNAETASGNAETFSGSLYATNSEVDHYGTGALDFGYGLNDTVFNRSTGTITNAYGLSVALSNLAKGKITTGYGVYVAAPVNSGGGTFSNFTGVYIASPTAVTGAYGLYSAGGKNYFAGDVGINTTTPGANLEVNGTTKFDGLATFASAQTFPGTLTGITAGSGILSTGGTKPTLSLNTTYTNGLYAALAGANSFTGKQTFGSTVTFASGQTFPGTLTGITAGSGILSTGGTNPTLSLKTVVTNGLYAQLTGGNTFSGNEQINTGTLTVTSGTNTTAINAYGSNGGIGGNFNGGSNTAASGGSGGYGLTVTGGNSSVNSGNGGYGLYVTGGASSGTNGESANGIISYGGQSSNTDITPGSGVVGIGGTSLDPTQTGGFGVWATGGTDNSGGVGGIGLYAGGGAGTTTSQQGYAALFDGIVEVGSLFNTQINTNTLLLGSPACGTGFVGIGIGASSFGDCTHYALISEGTSTYINRPSGGAIYFREANGTQMTIASGGAVAIAGNLTVSGTLSKHAGSFKIDDPLDPTNKYLYHSFVESPDMMNIYNGNAVLDGKGEAVIELPKWFQALNKDFRYQLTAIGAPGPNLYVAEEVANNHFKIAGGKPGAKVSWQVTGIRQDVYANAHRIPVEEEKPEAERGTYSYPELYAQPTEKAMGTQPNAHSGKEAVQVATSHSGAE